MEPKYKHKITGELLMLKKDYGKVASFWLSENGKSIIYGNVIVDTCVCAWENIESFEAFKAQLTLNFSSIEK